MATAREIFINFPLSSAISKCNVLKTFLQLSMKNKIILHFKIEQCFTSYNLLREILCL